MNRRARYAAAARAAVHRAARKVAGPNPAVTRLMGDLVLARRDVAKARQEVEQEVAARKAAQRANGDERHRANVAEQRLVAWFNIEPPDVEGCQKVRLRDRDEAQRFAERVANGTGVDIAKFRVYPCRVCPRQPIGTGRFLHITNDAGDAERSKGYSTRAHNVRRDGRQLDQRLDPAVVAKLRSIGGGA